MVVSFRPRPLYMSLSVVETPLPTTTSPAEITSYKPAMQYEFRGLDGDKRPCLFECCNIPVLSGFEAWKILISPKISVQHVIAPISSFSVTFRFPTQVFVILFIRPILQD